MSGDAGSSAEAGVTWSPPALADPGWLGGTRGLAPRGLLGLARRRSGWAGEIPEVRGPAACMRRDALFRRLLLVADVVAIVGAFVLTVELSRRSLELTWAGVAGVPI